MEWEKPAFIVIDMNAEIGSYQGDFEDDPDRVSTQDARARSASPELDSGTPGR